MTTCANGGAASPDVHGPPTLALSEEFAAAGAVDLVVAMRATAAAGELVLDVSAVGTFDAESLTAVLRGVRFLHEEGASVAVTGTSWAQFLDLFMTVPLPHLPLWVAAVRELRDVPAASRSTS